MSETVRLINEFFRAATMKDVDEIKINMLMSDRQIKIFEMFYVKKNDITYIAAEMNMAVDTVNKELRLIRRKLIKLL